ncbi:MAG TPA: chorismate synthase [Bacteroidales bacterium]|nr:MAG: chorismate synthase [Bacteroidetes bacterium GWE2_42_24]OFY26585.1 MAG: chorismate synthase [Bacteroidetes bacterium GWF2_43_11]HAQ65986.1 chorismate synthase [Bacteroidales bacterium]HBZ67464.1 chorismate synthase [Bacteroidales bacterium]
MASNSFGKIFRLTTFGESHGPAIGGVIDGCPAGLLINTDQIKHQLDRRKPSGKFWATPRNENDKVEFLSGITNGITNGAPIGFIIKNQNHKPEDYDDYSTAFRPSHADYSWELKYGRKLESGGGRQSARETIARVVAGSIARQFIASRQISIESYVSAIGPYALAEEAEFSSEEISQTALGCPDKKVEKKMLAYLGELNDRGDTSGGIITCLIKNVPAGIGEPIYDKLQARLGYAMLSINAVKGFEYGDGFAAAAMTGSNHNDPFTRSDHRIHPKSNHAGGILGGISTGEVIRFRVAFKPVSTLMQPQQSVDKAGIGITLQPAGRHDVCVVPRARVIVESMAAIVLADLIILSKTSSAQDFK